MGVRSRNKKEALLQKVKEWVLSVQLERRYTKNELIAMYLNIYDFGYNADGVQSAARIYFDKTPQELNIQECAMLVGMLKNSSLYNPIRRPELVKTRRNVVFNQMLRNDYVGEAAYDSLQALPIEINFTPNPIEKDWRPISEPTKEFMDDWIIKNEKPNGENTISMERQNIHHHRFPTPSAWRTIGDCSYEEPPKGILPPKYRRNPTAAPFLDLREGR